MATHVKYYVGEILEELSEMFSDVCEVQYNEDEEQLETVYTHRPSAVENHTEFLVISVSRSVYSHGPYQNAAIYFDMYVRNGQGGIPRIWRLQEICDSITEKFPIRGVEERWNLKEPKLVIEGDDQLGFFAWRLRASLFVDTTDRYYFSTEQNDNNN